MDKYKNLYQTNDDFKEYVDKYCACRGYSVEEALQHKVIHNYAEYLKVGDKNVR